MNDTNNNNDIDYMKLAAAVIQSAVEDYYNGVVFGYNYELTEKLFFSGKRFLFPQDIDDYNNLEVWCYLLGWRANYVRKLVENKIKNAGRIRIHKNTKKKRNLSKNKKIWHDYMGEESINTYI